MKINREKCFFLRSERARIAELFGKPYAMLPRSRTQVLKIIAIFSFVLMIFMQVRTIFLFSGEPTGDAARYVGDALQCVKAGTWYPTAENFKVLGGVAGTGYVNFLALLLRISPNMKIVYAANALLVQVILFSTAYIARRITKSETVKYIIVIIFGLFGTYWCEICIARTEIFFTALAMLSLALAVRHKKADLVAAGAILAVANWARPLAVSFVIATVWLLIYRRAKLGAFIRYGCGFAAAVLIMTGFTYFNSGEFTYQPTIASGNFLMGANENADGSYDATVFDEGRAGYIEPEQREKMTYKEVNAYFNNAGKQWIKENPGKYLLLMPKKVFYLYATETYSGDVCFNNEIATGGIAYFRSVLQIVQGRGDRPFTSGDAIIIYTQCVYMLIFLLFLAGVIFSMAKGYWRSMSFLYGIIIIGTVASIVSVGAARYHFPYLPLMFIAAAAFIDCVFVRRTAGKAKAEEI